MNILQFLFLILTRAKMPRALVRLQPDNTMANDYLGVDKFQLKHATPSPTSPSLLPKDLILVLFHTATTYAGPLDSHASQISRLNDNRTDSRKLPDGWYWSSPPWWKEQQ